MLSTWRSNQLLLKKGTKEWPLKIQFRNQQREERIILVLAEYRKESLFVLVI